MNDGSEGGNLRRGRGNGDDLMAGWRNKGKMRMEVGSEQVGMWQMERVGWRGG